MDKEHGEEPARLVTDEASHFGHHRRSVVFKVLKTVALIIVWVCIGLWSEVNGPTMQDLIFRMNTDYAVISSAVSMRGAGGLVGAILGGVFVDRFRHRADLIIAVSLVGCGTANLIIPYSRHVEVLFVVCGVEGLLEAMINIAGQWLVMQIWQEKASGPLHVLHLGYGAGAFIVPQLVADFISEKLPDAEENLNPKCLSESLNNTLNSSVTVQFANSPIANVTITTESSESLQYGFIIISVIVFLVAGILFFYAFLARKDKAMQVLAQEKMSLKKILDLNTCAPGHPYYAFLLYALMSCWIFVSVAGERTFAKYLYSFARDDQCYDKQLALNLQMAFWLSFTAGRFIGFVITNFIPMKFIIFIEGFGILVCTIAIFFGKAHRVLLFTFVSLAGIFIGPCYPSGLAWANRYIEVTGVGIMVVSIAAGISDISYLATIGSLIENSGIAVLTSVLLGYGIFTAILPVIQHAIARTQGDRFERMAAQPEYYETNGSEIEG